MKTKLVVFGITGDLAQTKLLPALNDIVGRGEKKDLSLIGVSRREVEPKEVLGKNSNLIGLSQMFQMDLADIVEYRSLRKFLSLKDSEQLVAYLSVPPRSATQIVEFMGRVGLNTDNVKILFEKPFGLDLVSALGMIKNTARYFDESQIYRIDHYMTKRVAAQLIHLRANANSHHHRWNKQSVKSVEIVASEVVGVGHRPVFYEQTGALRDIVQGHLMQLLGLVLMPIPEDFNMQKLPEYRAQALRRLKPADPRKAIRAQYQGYDKEVSNPGSLVETFVKIELQSSDPDWKGVKLQLVTGKKLAAKKTQIFINYRDGNQDVLDEEVLIGEHGVNMAYEKVLLDAIGERKAIFTSAEEVIRSWEVLEPLQKHWSLKDSITIYEPGLKHSDIH